MKEKNKYLPVCAAMYANYAAHGFGLIILTQTAAWLMEKFNTDMVGVSYLVSVMAIGKIVILAVSGVLSDKFGRKPFVFLVHSVLPRHLFCEELFDSSVLCAVCRRGQLLP